MGFVNRVKAFETPTSLIVKDNSGTFSPSDNPTGWGTQTVRPEWVTSAFIYVTPTRTTGIESDPIDVLDTLVLGQDDREYQVMPWDIGLKKIESEKYKIRYVVNVTFPDGVKKTYETYVYFVAIKQAECCLDKAAGSTLNTPLDNIFKTEPSRSLAQMSVIMRRVKEAIKCSDLVAADRMVYFIRLNCGCDC